MCVGGDLVSGKSSNINSVGGLKWLFVVVAIWSQMYPVIFVAGAV